MRLIDADVLLEQMKHRRDYVGRPSDPVCLVEDAPTVSGWVSVKDRMPEERHGRFEGEMESDFVLCCAKSEEETFIDMGYTVNGEWECESGYPKDYCEVTHWMPLPEPPKEDDA